MPADDTGEPAIGRAIIQVSATGTSTQLGKIGKFIGTGRSEVTELQKETRTLVKKLSWISVSLCAVIVVAYGLWHNQWLEGFLAGLALAMAILPNELPAVLLIFLALGAWRLSRSNVLTRKMPAIEALGATTALCVDKTGTLTLNRMSIQKLYSKNRFFGLHNPTSEELPEDFHELLEFGILASRKDPFDPMERAFQNTGSLYLGDSEHLHPTWPVLREYPLSKDLLAVSYVWKPDQGNLSVVGAKGAPEAIIDLCHFDAVTAKSTLKIAEEMASEGMRILGVAKSRFPHERLPEQQHDFEFEFLGVWRYDEGI
jgi:Ca2+-transporting ATPase